MSTSQLQDEQVRAWINRHIWLAGCDLDTEWRQAKEEGRDLASLEQEHARLAAVPAEGKTLGGARDRAWYEAAVELIDRIQALPLRAGYAYLEPSDLAGIRQARGQQVSMADWRGDAAEFDERILGGLLGRICGCLLGKPVEGWHLGQIRRIAEATGDYPLTNYFQFPDAAQTAALQAKGERTFREGNRKTTRPGIDGMVEDDDINYTTTGFALLKQYGASFTPEDVASFWCSNIPILHTCTAERVAYRNLAMLIPPPASATHRNPYREWIGAQIRADYFGFANPGRPERAAEWAWRDASISHIRNGIYGEMWVAAMYAAAYVESDWEGIIRAGLAQIPERSRLHEDVNRILAAYHGRATYQDAQALVHSQWNEKVSHHWCHTNSNAQVVAIGLLWGEDDYEKTITRAVMPGFDTDCNGATCGGLWGVKHGARHLPAKWTTPLNDRLRTGVSGYHDVKISALAKEMSEVARKHL